MSVAHHSAWDILGSKKWELLSSVVGKRGLGEAEFEKCCPSLSTHLLDVKTRHVIYDIVCLAQTLSLQVLESHFLGSNLNYVTAICCVSFGK